MYAQIISVFLVRYMLIFCFRGDLEVSGLSPTNTMLQYPQLVAQISISWSLTRSTKPKHASSICAKMELVEHHLWFWRNSLQTVQNE